ncbi:hypothetical protein BpHYR1_044131 [Brachionus plicatilis]|uniref:Uncharacterized protein n=1 Tax=Brachionus plicatilis TaxID=10195 RepID=A0A3M7RZS3_BRAPC|nr:hypothetical protein BpHYR1_044131 [Brachionus plicatilis]
MYCLNYKPLVDVDLWCQKLLNRILIYGVKSWAHYFPSLLILKNSSPILLKNRPLTQNLYLELTRTLNQGLAPDPFGLSPYSQYQGTDLDLDWLHLLLIYMGLKGKKDENIIKLIFSLKY